MLWPDDDLAACERESNAIAGNFSSFTFAEMEKVLKFSVRFLKACVVIDAAYVHPKLRTAAEKLLAGEPLAAFNAIAVGRLSTIIWCYEGTVPSKPGSSARQLSALTDTNAPGIAR